MSRLLNQHRSASYQQAEIAMVEAQKMMDQARLMLIQLGRLERRAAKRSDGSKRSLAMQNAHNLLKIESSLDEAIEAITARHGNTIRSELPLIYNYQSA